MATTSTTTTTQPSSDALYAFVNDYSESAHPVVMEAIAQAAQYQHTGYGLDDICERARQHIREMICQPDADVHFLVGGTQTNTLACLAALRPWEAVIASELGHIAVHETGAIEATGHKVIIAPSTHGKMTPADVDVAVMAHSSEHMVAPKMLFISNSTEIGTVYTKSEVESLSAYCREKGLYLFMDGARLPAALACPECDLTLPDIAALTDFFYIGGTKTGLLFGEALIIKNDALKAGTRHLIKQRGGLLAKGWLLGAQFEALLSNDLYRTLGAHANKTAQILKQGIVKCGYQMMADSPTNQLFVYLPNRIADELAKHFQISHQGDVPERQEQLIRLCTSWATDEDQCHALVRALEDITARHA